MSTILFSAGAGYLASMVSGEVPDRGDRVVVANALLFGAAGDTQGSPCAGAGHEHDYERA